MKYQATIWKSGKFDIIKKCTELPVICRIQERLGTTDHCITVLRNLIFESNFPHAFLKNIKWLNLVYAIRTNDDGISKVQYCCVYESVQVTPLINK